MPPQAFLCCTFPLLPVFPEEPCKYIVACINRYAALQSACYRRHDSNRSSSEWRT